MPSHTVLIRMCTSPYVPQQMYLHPMMVVCQCWHWMKQARSKSLGGGQHWDVVKWSLVTLCSTGERELPLTPTTQYPVPLDETHTPSPTSILVQCMKWELHQEAVLDWVDTAVGVGSRLQLITVSVLLKVSNWNQSSSGCLVRLLRLDVIILHRKKLSTQLSPSSSLEG